MQLSFLRGEKILILRQTTADWWWGQRAGCCGYIPANHVGRQVAEYDPEDTWQDEEYFGSYGTLVGGSQPAASLCPCGEAARPKPPQHTERFHRTTHSTVLFFGLNTVTNVETILSAEALQEPGGCSAVEPR